MRKKIPLPCNNKAVWKNIKWGRREGALKLLDLKCGGGEEYQVVWNYIHPCLEVSLQDIDDLVVAHQHQRAPNGTEHVREISLNKFRYDLALK